MEEDHGDMDDDVVDLITLDQIPSKEEKIEVSRVGFHRIMEPGIHPLQHTPLLLLSTFRCFSYSILHVAFTALLLSYNGRPGKKIHVFPRNSTCSQKFP